ncbi:MAG: nickel/cobalt efflux transporter [Terrimicrobiaceae bacterium]|jgi:nickel/cobalt exporter|nr:nickel/cobalt efflux transporter [Terrimicrobiaceae bacterium]
MPTINELLGQGAAHAWLYIPIAILLGALHGLEPGHSKTMMAAFIVAVRGTVPQAALLGVSAAFSHSLIIWLLAAVALRFGSQWNAETTEPYFQLASGVIIVGLAAWMFFRTRREDRASAEHARGHDHHADGPHGGQMLDTGHGFVEISVFETNVPPRFRLYFFDAAKKRKALPRAEEVLLKTMRSGGVEESFSFAIQDGYLEARPELPEPHEFSGSLEIHHGDHAREYSFQFREHEHHHHDGLGLSDGAYQDAHERAHATDIARRFANRNVSTGQIVVFGLTGGLLPCPAALTVLLVCLQLKQFTLGFALVLSFSFGLALTMVAVGAIAAWSVQHASKRIRGFDGFARKAPYFSSALLTCLGLYIGIQGWLHLP